MLPPRIPHTSGKPMPARTVEMRHAISRLPPRKTPRPRLIVTQILGVSPWFMKPTANASTIDRPRTRPLAFRANAISSATSTPLMSRIAPSIHCGGSPPGTGDDPVSRIVPRTHSPFVYRPLSQAATLGTAAGPRGAGVGNDGRPPRRDIRCVAREIAGSGWESQMSDWQVEVDGRVGRDVRRRAAGDDSEPVGHDADRRLRLRCCPKHAHARSPIPPRTMQD